MYRPEQFTEFIGGIRYTNSLKASVSMNGIDRRITNDVGMERVCLFTDAINAINTLCCNDTNRPELIVNSKHYLKI